MDIEYLSKQNPHERDTHISFEEGPHIYTIDGDSDFMSVTTWNHTHFDKFNADLIINGMMRGKNWKNSEYFGMTKEEIKAKWNTSGREAAEAGTKMHYDIECYYNNNDVINDSVEYEYFKKFREDYKNLKPYRSEWMIWDKDLKFAGSIDMIFENENGDLEIYDWKRCKEIKKESKWNKKAKTKCISHILDLNFWHYALQLNTYKALLEKNYGKKIVKMCLICLHPNNDNNSYLRYEVPDLSNEIKDLFEYRSMGLNDSDGLQTRELMEKREKLMEKIEKYSNYVNNFKNKLVKLDNELESLESDKEENIEVTSYDFEENKYLVDEKTNKVYDESGSHIGYWIRNKFIAL